MDILKAVLLGIAGAMLALVLRAFGRNEMALAVALASGIAILFFAVERLAGVVQSLSALAVSGGMQEGYFSVILRVTAIAMIAEFGVQACKDAGSEGLAQKVALGGKIAILSLCMPLLLRLADELWGFLP